MEILFPAELKTDWECGPEQQDDKTLNSNENEKSLIQTASHFPSSKVDLQFVCFMLWLNVDVEEANNQLSAPDVLF